MKLSECYMGRVVNEREIISNDPNYGKAKVNTDYSSPYGKRSYKLVGHIIGFWLNSADETIVKVRWNNGLEQDIHPGNLLIMED